jgi:hypothetical protein
VAAKESLVSLKYILMDRVNEGVEKIIACPEFSNADAVALLKVIRDKCNRLIKCTAQKEKD